MKKKQRVAATAERRGATVSRRAHTGARGGEAWVVRRDGEEETVFTSGTSVATIDEAVVIYRRILERLAKR